ncbi:hypothetical protein L226DRAFT_570212 [Lentinus tigrinus ALCF2SS1-7]|uniref:uncharacterized protein n=1 Tax=Lentinus tigrinus ALCF2SS1-7 TaxID=1328758 RepID=UPI0011661C88|nr:hypothetical protein L226DRAFT_570212 [Lentinus tigrinus ALCF2SS1-7]
MGEICLSLAPILRCQSLTRLEAGILLLPTGFEIIFAIVLLWVKRGSDKKHVFLASEVFVYFLLAVLDLLTHTIPTIGNSLDSFKSLDIIIGVASFIPLFLYTFALYLLTTTELIPALPVRFQTLAKYVLFAFIPLIILMNELGSFVGITYRSFGGVDGTPLVLGVGFTDSVTQMFLSSVTLVLLTAFQAANFCIAFYRLVKALSHQRSLDSQQSEKEMEAHLFRGLGWIVAGTKLGAIETVIGFASGGFGIVFTRRILRLLGHGCLIIGMVKGVDTVEDFKLYSPGESQRRRKSTLRAMIANPRFSTFRHVGGHDFTGQNPFDEKRSSVIKLGDPSWMRRDRKLASIDEERATPGLLNTRKSSSITFNLASHPSLHRKAKGSRDSGSSFGSTRHDSWRNSWPYARSEADEYADVQEDAQEIDVPAAVPRPRLPRPPVDARQRVTVHIRQDRLPVLELRRFSNLEFLDLIQDPFRDPHNRALSLPGTFEPAQQHPVNHVSASFTRLPAYGGARKPGLPSSVARKPSTRSVRPVQQPSLRESVINREAGRVSSFASYDRPWSNAGSSARNYRDSAVSFGEPVPPQSSQRTSVTSFVQPRGSTMNYDEEPASATSFHAIGSPDATITSWETPGSRATARLTVMSRKDRGLSSSTTASDVHELALQFPVIPPRPFATGPIRRSMLSQEVPRSEFIAEGVEQPVSESPEHPSPEPVPSPPVARIPSVKRKPAPLMTEGLYDERIRSVEIEQVIDEDVVAVQLPTPMSAPHRGVMAASRRTHSAELADVPLTPEDDDSFVSGEVEIARSASLVRRGAGEGPKLVRVKSVGNAPMRSVSSAHRTAFTRDSVKVELGHIAREGKLAAAASVNDEVIHIA